MHYTRQTIKMFLILTQVKMWGFLDFIKVLNNFSSFLVRKGEDMTIDYLTTMYVAISYKLISILYWVGFKQARVHNKLQLMNWQKGSQYEPVSGGPVRYFFAVFSVSGKSEYCVFLFEKKYFIQKFRFILFMKNVFILFMKKSVHFVYHVLW